MTLTIEKNTISDVRDLKERALNLISSQEEEVKKGILALVPNCLATWKENEAETLIDSLFEYGRFSATYRPKMDHYQCYGYSCLEDMVDKLNLLGKLWIDFVRVEFEWDRSGIYANFIAV